MYLNARASAWLTLLVLVTGAGLALSQEGGPPFPPRRRPGDERGPEDGSPANF